MTDPYLLLTPVLALAVLALARFVGCHWVFDLEEVPPVPDEVHFVNSYELGPRRNEGSDPNPFTGWAGMIIRVGAKPLTVTQLGRIMEAGSTTEHLVKIVERAGNTEGIDRGIVTIPPSAATQGFVYATLQTQVVLTSNTEYYLVSYEAANTDVFYDRNTTVVTTDVAQVRGSVYNGVNPDTGYQRNEAPEDAGTTFGPVDFIYQEPA
jgi:hypothetical protein